jgi:hypothetical protein
VKTGKQDVIRLIRLLIADMVPEMWVPPVEVRQLRPLISYRKWLVKTSTMIQNRLHSLLHRHNIAAPEEWWQKLLLSPLEDLRLRQELELLKQV